ncbi:hypothetical protein ERICIV_01736 [Paenibacillus larvae subsp. larvae]|uniref:Uncharacterized protein n=1 Tax=Paenibacillus larvae subsp. larvae TaxID=147375 RepID=A0A2L1UCL6_9BACL|nr:hypothetical protein [Paenibacillus larvae]AQT86334.1 hypothetical protein B1222_21055 [Paenibacillus larvae subsp. pulvifaciens]AQZ47983.1 hypothetical protein B5S25_16700 [Paenibacillus larvae subsp. pulvifaciens]AVF25893.1 hypothetical protein ERICIII_01715 [Paenibacillus larvae subsp. larvae]AVF30670.1 hypothetical protein ERICIV_01736 [Paenibacillus larvae subsp. larvae]MBH0343601.1 hypothetical protein [Paenibacillus larvae]
MDSLIQSISGYPNGTILVVEWTDGKKIRGWIDTIFETDNGIELDDENYQEYYAFLIRVQSVLQKPLLKNEKKPVGSLIEVSERDNISKISLEDGTVIWKSK